MSYSRRAVWYWLTLGILITLAGCQQPHPVASAQSSTTSGGICRVYVGTFTQKNSKGIYLLRLDEATGRLSGPELAVATEDPSFLALRRDGRFLYCVNEIDQFNGNRVGSVSAFAIEPSSGALKLLNQEPSGGAGPTHLSIDRTGRAVLVANYAGGSVALLPAGADGRLDEPSSIDQHWGSGADRSRQDAPHAHSIYPDPGNRFALSCDLGLDKVFIYKLDPARGMLAPNDPAFVSLAPGSGPRHLAFAPSGQFVYVNGEMACTVTAFNYDAEHGRLHAFQTISTLPAGFSGERSTAEIVVHPSGRFLYVSNRGAANSITVFRIDPRSGQLALIGQAGTRGRTPRGFGIDPTGRWLIAANQDTDNLVVFRINPETGRLTPNGVNVTVPTPVCVTFAP